MTATRRSLLIVPLLCGALVAGCGSSSSTTSSSTTTTTSKPATSSTAAATTATSPTGTTSATSTVSAATLAQAVATCKSAVQKATTLSASVKAKLEGICNKAASGDLAGARTAAREVCVEVVNATPIPSSAAKQQALAACKTAY